MFTSFSKGVNQLHRTALNQAIHRMNTAMASEEHTMPVAILVGTKNIVLNIMMAIFSRHYVILYFTGLGRLYTDLGIIGKFIFVMMIALSSLRKNRKFIVENAHDRRVISRWTRRDVALINGSGFNKALYKNQTKKASKQTPHTIGHMSRFGKSKCTDQIIKMINTLPADCKMILAGKDISGSFYSDRFYQLAQSHPQVEMIGFLETPEEVSAFFQKIDVFLYPSVREGLPITLLESIHHHVPFLTTNVAGCIDLSNRFGFPAYAPEDFGEQDNHLNLQPWGQYTPRWDEIMKDYSTASVQTQFEEIFQRILDEDQPSSST